MIYNTDNENKLFNNIEFYPKDARTLGILIKEEFSFNYDNKGDIISINLSDNSISIHDQINIKFSSNISSIYVINKITKTKPGILDMYDCFISTGTINKNATYILPIYGYNYRYFSVDERLINSYISLDYNYLYLRYRYNNVESFKELERRIRNLPDFYKIINDTNYSITYQLKIPTIYKEDIQKIFEGKYSSITQDLKNLIIKFHDNESYFEAVLNKSSTLKAFLEKSLDVKIPNNIDLESKPYKQLELWQV